MTDLRESQESENAKSSAGSQSVGTAQKGVHGLLGSEKWGDYR